MMKKCIFMCMLLLVLLPATGICQPVFSSSFIVNEEKIFRDKKNNKLFYYMPPAYQLLADAAGRPSFSLVKMRYTGTIGAGDNGKYRTNNILQFRVGTDTGYLRKVNNLAKAIVVSHPGAVLRVLPIRKFASMLVFAGVTSGKPDSVENTKAGYAELTDEGAEMNNSYWNERLISFRLTDADAQIVESAIRNQQAALSFSYAYYSAFADTAGADINIGGNSALKKEIKDVLNEQYNNYKDSSLALAMIRADAIPVSVNIIKWPTAIEQIDINEKVPAKYPVFYVYCYDFNNEMRYDLFAKKIELKATSINGSSITRAFLFKFNQPDQYARNIQFGYAVRFDKPFYYRVTEITQDGEATVSDWKQKESWNEIIDITSPPEKIVRKPVVADEQQ